MSTVKNTYGPLLLGAFVASCLSGIVTVQSFLYIKLYPNDPTRMKVMVGAVWLLDTLHTCSFIVSIWGYLIAHFGDEGRIDFIPWSVAMTIAITAAITLIVHCFLIQRIHMLTNKDWRITGPILVLAVSRLCSASVAATEMIRIHSFEAFKPLLWLVTLGLALSSTVDILITIVLCYKLRSRRTESISMNSVIDSMILYTFENGLLTCAATVLSMICWVTMPSNRIWMGVYFMIGKLYANSLLANLNTRKQLREGRFQTTTSGDHILPVIFPDNFSGGTRRTSGKYLEMSARRDLQINVHKVVETRLDEDRVISIARTDTLDF